MTLTITTPTDSAVAELLKGGGNGAGLFKVVYGVNTYGYVYGVSLASLPTSHIHTTAQLPILLNDITIGNVAFTTNNLKIQSCFLQGVPELPEFRSKAYWSYPSSGSVSLQLS